MKKSLLLLLLMYSFSFCQTNSTKSLTYELPPNWSKDNLQKNKVGITYGGSYVDEKGAIDFSVIEVPSPSNKTSLDDITNDDFRGSIRKLFHPNSNFGLVHIKNINSVKTKYINAWVKLKGKEINSMNYVTIYKRKVIFIQGIINREDLKEAQSLIHDIVKTIKFKK